MGQSMEGKTALITGASRGIGLAIARQLVEAGARVCITARNADDVAAAVTELQRVGEAIGIPGKADDEEHQRSAVAATIEQLGSLDLLVNNAATSPQFGPLIDADLGAVRKIFEVNVTAALAWTQKAWVAWMRDHGGSVLNISSVGGLRPGPSIGAYNASKAALIHLTQQLAVELGPVVRVNAIAPGLVKTRFASPLIDGQEETLSAMYPMKRLGEPIDVGTAAAFLLSDDASWITGATLVIDGGEMTISAV